MRYAPLFIHSFVLCAPRKILEATQFNQRYRRYEEIDNVPDRLQWCRHSKGLMQVEVADKVGMTHSVYKAIEEGFTQHIEPEKVDRLAQFYGVPVTTSWMNSIISFMMDRLSVFEHTGNPSTWVRNPSQGKWASWSGVCRNGRAAEKLSA